MSIVNNCMVVNLTVRMWNGYKLDKEISEEVISRAGAKEDTARVNKHLIDKQVLRPIVAAAGPLRNHFYSATLPWKDNGDRLLTRKMYFDFTSQHRLLREAFEDAVNDFLANDYLTERDRASFRMGDLFKAEDYPDVDALRKKFSVRLDIDAVTEVGDFRVDMDADTIAEIRADMEESLQQRITGAVADVWKRLAEVVGRFHSQVSSDDPRIFSSTVEKLRDIVEVLPALNITNDANLELIRQDIARSLTDYDVTDLRKKDHVRGDAAAEAKRIKDRIPDYLRPCDSHLVPMLNEMKMDHRNISRAVNSLEYGMVNASLPCVIVGGLGGGTAGAAVINVASYLIANITCLTDYHILHPIHVRHIATSTSDVLWVINATAQAFARHAPMIIVSDIYPKSGAGTKELFYETAANAIVNAVSGGYLGCWSR